VNGIKNLGVEYCDFCGGKVSPQKVTFLHRCRGREQLFNDVDVEMCEDCGEKYFHTLTLNDLDRRIFNKA
jgi:YgiT-type zinc finger domain-containing protein